MIEFNILELRTEQNQRTNRPIAKLFLVTLSFDPEKYQQTFPCLSCGAKNHTFKVFKDKVFNYCPRTHVTMPVTIYRENDELMPYLEIVKEKPMGRNEAIAYLKEKRIIPNANITLALM